MMTTASEQLAWEARRRPFAAGAAVLAGLLFFGGNIYLSAAVGEQPRGIAQQLVARDRDADSYVIAALLLAGAYGLLGIVLSFLYRVTRYRRRELPTAALALTVFGSVAAAAVAIVAQFVTQDIAAEFVASGPPTTQRATELQRDSTALKILSGAGLAAHLALGMAMVFIGLNALRAGLLSRFMGGLGIAIGVLLAVPLFGTGTAPLLFLFWLGAIAAILLDRWPGGRGRAWETGQATPWPTMAEQNAELQRRRRTLESGSDPEGTPEEDDEEYTGGDGAPATTGRGVSGGNGAPAAASRAKRKRGRSR